MYQIKKKEKKKKLEDITTSQAKLVSRIPASGLEALVGKNKIVFCQ